MEVFVLGCEDLAVDRREGERRVFEVNSVGFRQFTVMHNRDWADGHVRWEMARLKSRVIGSESDDCSA